MIAMAMSGAQPNPTYAELQVTTNFSFLRGGSHPHELVIEAARQGLSAIAIGDRNTLAGVVRAHLAAKEHGVRLIVGARLDLQDAPSLLCLPTDRGAYGRLSRLLSLGQARAEKGDCILYLDDVAQHRDGQIFIALAPDDWQWREALRSDAHDTTADAADGVVIDFADGTLHQTTPTLMSSHASLFETRLNALKKALAPAPLYLAASHLYRGDDRARIGALHRLSERCCIPLVATNDIHYHVPERRPLQDVLTCIREKTTIKKAGFHLTANGERHIKSTTEMTRLFHGFEDAVLRTTEIAEACRFSLDELKYEYPDEPVPPGHSPQSYLEEITWRGAQWRFPDGIPDKITAIVERELALIAELNYAPYFLTVYDIVRFARSQDILCQGRGSAANSVVCYCLAITSVDPTEVDLLFERFISPGA